ncbi:hypothetical protein J6590_073395 [Homalodisca vitripennis]|nr:hypothetical protein J6590_073395 [Homalodisca vitripennis]
MLSISEISPILPKSRMRAEWWGINTKERFQQEFAEKMDISPAKSCISLNIEQGTRWDISRI